ARVDSLTYNPITPSCPNPCTTSNFVDGTDKNRTNLFSGKLTLRLGEANTVAVSAFGDPATNPNSRITTARGPESAVLADVDTGGTDISARYDGIFGSFLVQAQYGHHQDKSSQKSPYADTLSIGQFRRGLIEFIPGSGPALLQDETYKRDAGKLA